MFNFVHGGIDYAHKMDFAGNAAESYYRHVHPFHEIIYFVGGEVAYTVESETRALQPGDLVLISSGKYHFATVNSEEAYERYVLKFPDAFLPDFLRERIRTLNPFFGTVKECAARFRGFDSYVEYGNYTDRELSALFVVDTVKLLIMLSKENTAAAQPIGSIIGEITSYIEENIYTRITLDDLSAVFHFSKSYISNEFKQEMKIPIMQYIRLKKIACAHRLIQAGEKKSQVAEKLGFNDYSTFYRQYLKFAQEDLLPAEGRRK